MRRFVDEHLHSSQVARVIYGSIIGLAVVVAFEHHPPSAGVMVATLLGTAVAVGLAEAYSEVVGIEVRTHARVGRRHLGEIGRDVAAVAFGIAFPVTFFLLAAAHAIEIDTAFHLAKWSGLGLVAVYGFVAARLAGQGIPRALLQAAAVALICAFLIALKAIVH